MLFYFYTKISYGLRFGFCCGGGRNIMGRVCFRGRGGGNKRLFFKIDVFRRICQFGIVYKILKDSRRSAYIGCLLYANGLVSYIILTTGSMFLNYVVYSGLLKIAKIRSIEDGWATSLDNFPLFSQISNIEFKPSKGLNLVRAAGSHAILISKNIKNATLKLKSGWQLQINLKCFAVKGQVSNIYNIHNILGKAGISSALGFRPKVRGLAKNPCDHPHGGGNGKKHKPVNPVTPWGKFTTGKHTKCKQHDFKHRRLFKVIN